VRNCKQCGEPLQALTSVASDPHDEPAYYCPCWPTGWPVVALQVGIIASVAAAFYAISVVVP